MTVHVVGTNAELSTALDDAVGGDEIVMDPGAYSVSFSSRTYGGPTYVTVRSDDPLDPATFTNLVIHGSNYLHIRDVKVANTGVGTSSSKIVDIDNNSHHIRFTDSEVRGKSGSYSGWYGLHAGHDASDVEYLRNTVRDVRQGVVVIGCDAIDLLDNDIDFVGEDFIKFGVQTVANIERNILGGNAFPASGDHPDFIQAQGAVVDGRVVGNVGLLQRGVAMQGMELAPHAHTNLLVEQNIMSCSGTGARVENSTGVTVRNNTILNINGVGLESSDILVFTGSSHSNVTGVKLGSQGVTGTPGQENHRLQDDNPATDEYYDDYYVNGTAGLALTIEDLRPVEGGPGDDPAVGAYTRIMELLSEGTPGGFFHMLEDGPDPGVCTVTVNKDGTGLVDPVAPGNTQFEARRTDTATGESAVGTIDVEVLPSPVVAPSGSLQARVGTTLNFNLNNM